MNAQFPPPPTRHHNNPPLPERIVVDFDQGLADREANVVKLLDTIEAKAAAFGDCKSEADVGAFGETIKTCAAVIKEIDAEYEIHNRPLLDAGKALRGRVNTLKDRAEVISNRLRKTMDAWLAEQKRIDDARRAEEARVAREAELARQREIARLQEVARAEAEAERLRLQAIEDAKAEAERARLQAIEDARAEAAGREAARIEAEAVKVEVAPEPVYVPPPAPVFVTPEAPRGPIRGDYGTAVSVVETWNVAVENIRQVPDAYLRHPTVIEALEKVIRPLVKGKSGLREIKGCRIYSTTGSSVR